MAKKHANLDKQSIVYLGLVDDLLIIGGACLGAAPTTTSRTYPILWGARMILKVQNQVVKFESLVFSFSFSRNALKLNTGRSMYK
jgi:hypothetical protein